MTPPTTDTSRKALRFIEGTLQRFHGFPDTDEVPGITLWHLRTLLTERDAALFREKSLKDNTEELRQLRREFNAVKAERDGLQVQLDAYAKADHALVDKYRDPIGSGSFTFPDDVAKIIRKLEADADEARSALKVYADKSNWTNGAEWDGLHAPRIVALNALKSTTSAPREVTMQEAVLSLIPMLHEKHIAFYEAKGRDPKDYTSKFSVAADTIRTLVKEEQSDD